jgi:hypothetical protein
LRLAAIPAYANGCPARSVAGSRRLDSPCRITQVAGPADEAINPATLAIDKMAVEDIIDIISGEDRRVVTAVHRERERIAHGVDILVALLARGPDLSRRRRHERSPRCRRGGRNAADIRHAPGARAGDHGRRPGGVFARERVSKTTSRKGPAVSRASASPSGTSSSAFPPVDHAVRARRAYGGGRKARGIIL